MTLPSGTPRPRVLFVDDDRLVRTAYQRQLRTTLDVVIAGSAEEALTLVREGPPFAAVFTDYEMPGMHGVALLARIRSLSPRTVRILFTGKAELLEVAAAVNEAEIFRLLLKPCATTQLWACIEAALARYAETGTDGPDTTSDTVGVALAALIHQTNPSLHQRLHRLRQYAQHTTDVLALPHAGRYLLAVTLAGLGQIGFDRAKLDRYFTGHPADADERAEFQAQPATTSAVIATLPGLADVSEMIAGAGEDPPASVPFERLAPAQIGAQLLRTIRIFDMSLTRGQSRDDTIAAMRARQQAPTRLLDALMDLPVTAVRSRLERLVVADLEAGMVLEEPVRAHGGLTLAPAGQVISPALLQVLHGYVRTIGVAEPILVRLSGSE
ncbi:response regulator [Luteitalea sp.]